MELITLDSSFQPDRIVENFQSLIWTERYSKNGDFELKSYNIPEALDLLPLESYISLRESNVPMVVEQYKIEKGPRKAPLITITGRSFETVLERRASANSLPTSTVPQTWTISGAKESDAAYKAMRIVLGDEPRYKSGYVILPLLNPAVDANDAIAEIDLTLPADYSVVGWSSTIDYDIGDVVGVGTTLYVAILGGVNHAPASSPTYWTPVTTFAGGTFTLVTPIAYDIKLGDLYSTVVNLLNVNHRGLKAVRPLPGSSRVGIEIYNGADLTADVVFDARFDQFDDSTYLLSNQGSTNLAYVFGTNGATEVLKTTAPEPSGLNRRVLVVDQSSDSTTNTVDVRRTRGLIELYKYNVTALFDGQISQQVAEGYNTDYFLGDIVKLVGEYGLSQNVRVAEFIRSADATGTKAYPAFEAVDD